MLRALVETCKHGVRGVVLREPRGPKTEMRISLEETIKPVEAGGLKLTQLVELPPYHYGVVFKRSSF